MVDFSIERRFQKLGYDEIIGVDEAGRGPLAGPVVASAILLKSRRFRNRIDDSKKLTENQREDAFLEIIQKSLFSVSIVEKEIIDAKNILVATRLCMKAAIISLLEKSKSKNVCVLVDGNIKLDIENLPVFDIIGGDGKSKTIASASIIAKVSRDRIMLLYDKIWPIYGFIKHKGYPTYRHRLAIREFGLSPIHRLTFSYA